MKHRYRIAAVAAAVFAMALALLAASPASAEPAPAERAAAPQIGEEVASGFERFVAEPVTEDGASTSQQPPDALECLWGWNVEVGGFYPEAWLRYSATFECSQIGPNVAGTVQGSLHDSPGGLLLHTGPDEGFAWCCSLVYPPAVSGGEITLTEPDSFYINSDSIVDLLPEPDGAIWLWATLPDGCTGIASPRAICDIDFESFDIT